MSVLTIDDLTVRFSGVTALAGVSFEVRAGDIHAVIGPNGAGKSTLFNVISGAYRPAGGSVAFRGTRLSGRAPHRIAELGVARTFQNIALLPGETVEENLMLGRHRLIRTFRREGRRHRDRVREIAAFVGLANRLATVAGVLSYGEQKRVEMARALCGEPELLLLDEPAAGMNAHETAATAGLIRAVRDSLEIAIVLVEHDMGLVMGIADRVTVLDFGRLIADGAPDEVRADPAVQTAYLGVEPTC